MNAHRALTVSLADHVAASGMRTYVELRTAGWQTNPVGIPDVLAMKPMAYGSTTWSLAAYEVKVNKFDLARDLQFGKWQRYVDELGVRFVLFATTRELAEGVSWPHDVGVVVCNDTGWRRVRAPRSLQGSIGKVNPGLLLAMLDNVEHGRLQEVQRRSRRRTRLRLFEEIVGKCRDEDFECLAESVGHEFASRARRAARESHNVRAIETWAESVLQAVASLRGQMLEDVRNEVVRNGYDSRGLTYDLELAAFLAKRSKDIHSLVSAAATLLSAREDAYNFKSATELAQAVAS